MESIDSIYQMEPFQWAIFLVSALLFISAKIIAHRAVTFYVSGAVCGVLLSVLFLAIVIRRFLPKKLFMIPVDLLGWPALSYLYYYGYSHFQEILKQNWRWLALYVIVAVTISLIICYISEVESNIRIRNVLQWTLQAVSVLLMFYSSQSLFLSLATVLTILAIDRGALQYIWNFIEWLTRKPETRKYLTIKEYEDEGAEFTKKELEKLRLSMLDDCRYSSPNKSLTKRCTNQDQLASFLMTSQDVSLRSQLEHRKEYNQNDYASDDNDSLIDLDNDLLLTDDDF